MAGITGGVIAGISAAAGVSESRKQRKAASRAADQQAAGVEAAQEEVRQARERALGFVSPAFQRARTEIGRGFHFARPELERGFEGAIETLDPIAALADPTMREQLALLNLSGEGEFQNALSRVSDPLQAEQERAFRRNVGALGQVGGNALSQLAEMTRARTEANIGNRLAQLQAAGAPGINALSRISDLNLQRGQNLGEFELQRNQALGNLEIDRARTEAGAVLGQVPQLTQLAQNLGVAQSGGNLYRASNPSSLISGLSSGLQVAQGVSNLLGAQPFSGAPQAAPVTPMLGRIGGGAALSSPRLGG